MGDQSDIIKHSDFAEEGFIKNYSLKEFQELVAYLPTVDAAIIATAKKLNDAFKGLSIENLDVEGLKKMNDQVKQANDLALLNEKLRKAEAQANAALQKERQEEIKTTRDQNKLSEEESKAKQKKIVLTNQQIAQNQIDNASKRDLIALLKAEIIELDKTAGSLQRVEAANTRLRIERKSIDTTTIEGRRRLIELNEEINRNNKYIIENSDKLKQHKLNVGNYTESIKAAFEGTGALGEALNKYLSIIEILSSKIEGLVSIFVTKKTAEEASTVATNANTVAEEKNATATEAATVAEETNIVTLEAETAATEAATVASEGLGKSLLALAKNPFVIAAIAIAALAKVVYDNVTATQAQKDAWDANEEGLKAWSKAILVAGVDAGKLREDIKNLTYAEFARQDLDIKALIIKKQLRAEAAEARSQATEEGKTTRERIDLLQEFVDKTREASRLEREELEQDVKIKHGIVDAYGKLATREQRRQLQEAVAALSENRQETANSIRKSQNQITSLTKKYNDDIRKMMQDAQKEEIELIDTFSKYKAEQLTKQLAKDLKLNKVETDQKVSDLKKQQQEMGAIDKYGVDHTAEFELAILDLKKTGASKAKALTDKTNNEIAILNEDFRVKQIEAEEKYQQDLRKLDESYIKFVEDIDKQQQDNELQNNQFEIDHEQDKIDDLQEKRKEEIESGKEKYNLTLNDLKKYFDQIDRLDADHYEKSKKKLKDEADFNKYIDENKKNDAIQALRDKYIKIQYEDEKAIRNKNKDPKIAQQEVDIHNAALAKQEADEIEKIERDLAIQIEAIDVKLKGDLDKADEDDLKRKRAVLKKKQAITKQEIEDQKKLAAERIKIVDDITKGVEKGLAKQEELQQQSDQRTVDFHTRNIETQAKLAAAGRANVLAEEEAAATRAEEKKLQDAKRAEKQQQNIQLASVFLKAVMNALDRGENVFKALAEGGIAEEAASASIAALFSGSAYDGTEDTGPGGSIDNKGGMLYVMHPHEAVVKRKSNEEAPGLAKAWNEDGISGVHGWAFENIYGPMFKSSNVSSTQEMNSNHDSIMTQVLSNKIEALQRTIESKPVSSTNLDRLGEWIDETEQRGMRTIIHHKRQNTRPSLRLNS